MASALPLLRDGVFQEEHRRIRQRLLRLRKLTERDAGFPSRLAAMVAVADEIEALLPVLTAHFTREERALNEAAAGEEGRPSQHHETAENLMAEHQPLLRELRALLESARRVVEDLQEEREAGSMAEALKAYLSACVQDLLDHEESERTALQWGPETPTQG